MARFSVVVPAYNAARTIEATIRSIQGQTERDFELIVVDDGSTDATAGLVSELAEPRLHLVRQENVGLAGARNSGIAVATGTYVAFLDADDLWLPGYLAGMRDALARDEGAAVAYADGWVLQHSTGRIRRTTAMAYQNPPETPLTDRDALFRRLLRNNFVLSSVTVRRAVLDEVGVFRPDLRRSEDYELWLRIVANGYHLTQAPGRLWVRREIDGSLSSSPAAMYESGRRVYDIVATTYAIDGDLRRLAEQRRDDYARRQAAAVDPSQRRLGERALDLARRLKRRVDGRRLWLEEAPADVAALLAAVDDPSL